MSRSFARNFLYTFLGVCIGILAAGVIFLLGWNCDSCPQRQGWCMLHAWYPLILAIMTGLFADTLIFVKKYQNRKKEELYKELMIGVKHQLNNLLNHFQIVEVEQEDTGKISENTIKRLKDHIHKTDNIIRELCANEVLEADEVNTIAFQDVYSKNIPK
ncbi:MAG: hypothetical protein HQL32_05535 [Planctomycetes bacterium]|nr:hypothetical protein [Planctomycetota bacterium]